MNQTEMTVFEFQKLQDSDIQYFLLDVREDWEVEICTIKESHHIPLSNLATLYHTLPEDMPIIVFCHHGMRSLRATLWLREKGYLKTMNLKGGIDAWASEIDKSMKKY